jgi:HEAT repeat protein
VKFCRRIFPTLFEENDWKIALLLTRAADRAGKENGAFKKDRSLSPTPQRFIYKKLTEDLVAAYENADDAQRTIIDEIAGLLGPQGIEVLSNVLSETENRQARKFATDALIQQGEKARQWVIKALGNPDQPWYLLRNTLMILRSVGKGEEDIESARQFISHEHPRVRDEALHTFLALKAPDAEQIVIDALEDPDDKVQWRATAALSELAPLSDTSVAKIIQIIKAEIPQEEDAAGRHSRKICNIIRTLGTGLDIKNIQAVEESIIEIAKTINGRKKGILNRLKKSSSPHYTAILSAAIATLGKIGTANSEAFLKKLAGAKTAQAEAARKAIETIHARYAKQQDGAPAAS